MITPGETKEDQAKAAKYSYIDNSPAGVSKFMAFVKKKFPAATHVNFYCSKTGNFMEKIHLI